MFLFFSNAVFFSKNWFGEKNLKKLFCSVVVMLAPEAIEITPLCACFCSLAWMMTTVIKFFFLSSSSNTFQIWISSVLCVLLNKFLNVVLDDLMIYLKYCQSMVN